MKKWLIVLLVFLVPMGLFYTLSKFTGNDTMEQAQAADKPSVLKFTSTMCVDCQELEKIIKEISPKYQDQINFISYKVDSPGGKVKSLISKYNITLVPTMILVDKNGKDKLKIEGLVSKETLETHLKALANE